jgi:hypothetical protein
MIKIIATKAIQEKSTTKRENKDDFQRSNDGNNGIP